MVILISRGEGVGVDDAGLADARDVELVIRPDHGGVRESNALAVVRIDSVAVTCGENARLSEGGALESDVVGGDVAIDI